MEVFLEEEIAKETPLKDDPPQTEEPLEEEIQDDQSREPVGSAPPGDESESTPVSDVMDPEDSAEGAIELYDTLCQLFMPWVAERQAFSKDERNQLKKLVRRANDADAKKEDIEVSGQEKELLLVYEDLQDWEETILPLSDKQQDRLRKPLAKVLAKLQVNITPQKALLFTWLGVTAIQMAPLAGFRRERNKRRG